MSVEREMVALEDVLDAWHDFCGEYGGQVAVLRTQFAATIRALPRADGWRDIETAPKDGTPILVARHDTTFGWVRGWARWEEYRGIISGWLAWGFFDPPGELGLANPTHWQPLPASPEPKP